MIMQIIRLKTNLSEEELLKRAHEREPQFKAIPGLVQKYYVKMGEPNSFGGVYVWDSEESLQTFRQSELAASIPKAYELAEAPGIEVLDVLFSLRE
ncbi:YdhR family protein [Mangrovibacterium diazotrophicum]|uniref:Putative monooxygenase ydhR n=1 Tax=Mangrovibacterium diazotrophicum TaxID=1261403 RepID=A0A419W6W7_9BACT|nr:YdhR family protein [Mangrovibacterium diazotrophicum]RKD91112.1 putative monooxygenase ydhR [Mangrovibacterium diazotrophicum]